MRWIIDHASRELLSHQVAGGPRRDVHSLLFRVRAYHRDLQQLALDEPARWGIWAVPSPVRDADARALSRPSGIRRPEVSNARAC